MPRTQVTTLFYPGVLPEPFLLAGFVEYPAGMRAERYDRHSFAQAVLVLEGRFQFEPGDGAPVVAEAGEVLVVPTGSWHRYGVAGERDCQTFMVNFHVPSQALFGNAADAFCGGAAEGPWRAVVSRRAREALVADLRRECSAPGPASIAVMQALLGLFLARVAEDRMRREQNGGSGAIPLSVLRALRVVETRYATPLSLPELARAAGLGVSRFCEAFRQHVGVPPMAYLEAYRLRTAAVLLRSSGFPVGSIARHVGFSSPQYLARRFRAAHGCTPTEYRRQAQPRAAENAQESGFRALP